VTAPALGRPAAVPFTILTGWLGAGKTTTLNQLLGASGGLGRRVAVLVNELGRIAIDTKLIIGGGGDVLELAGGCICCKVDLKSDLWDGIGEVIVRSRPEHVVLETTGIAEPAAILANLDRVPVAVRDLVQPAGVVCVVDAEAAASTLSRREEAREQVLAADRLLLRKLDRADADAVRTCHHLLDELAPGADRASFPDDEAGVRALAGWLLAPRRWTPPPRPTHRHDGAGDHGHGGQLAAMVFTDDQPLLAERVLAVVRGLGDQLIRAKGFVHLAEGRGCEYLEKAGLHTSLGPAPPSTALPRRSELVLIGDGLDEAAIRRALWACRVGARPDQQG
jgi:G3E family GTPase